MNRDTAEAVIKRGLAAYRSTDLNNDMVAQFIITGLENEGAFKPPKAVPVASAAGAPDDQAPSAIALDPRNADGLFTRYSVGIDSEDADYTAIYCCDCEEQIESGMDEWSVSVIIQSCLDHNKRHHGG